MWVGLHEAYIKPEIMIYLKWLLLINEGCYKIIESLFINSYQWISLDLNPMEGQIEKLKYEFLNVVFKF